MSSIRVSDIASSKATIKRLRKEATSLTLLKPEPCAVTGLSSLFSSLEWDSNGEDFMDMDAEAYFGAVEPWTEQDSIGLIHQGIRIQQSVNAAAAANAKSAEELQSNPTTTMHRKKRKKAAKVAPVAPASEPVSIPIPRAKIQMPKEIRQTQETCQTNKILVKSPSAQLKSQVSPPPKVERPSASEWRKQRLLASMTMRELKKVFPPLVKKKELDSPVARLQDSYRVKDGEKKDMIKCFKSLVKCPNQLGYNVSVNNLKLFRDDWLEYPIETVTGIPEKLCSSAPNIDPFIQVILEHCEATSCEEPKQFESENNTSTAVSKKGQHYKRTRSYKPPRDLTEGLSFSSSLTLSRISLGHPRKSLESESQRVVQLKKSATQDHTTDDN